MYKTIKIYEAGCGWVYCINDGAKASANGATLTITALFDCMDTNKEGLDNLKRIIGYIEADTVIIYDSLGNYVDATDLLLDTAP